jgi:ABC-2 type transport system permease protein
MHKIHALMRKEWTEVFRNRFVLFAVAFMPLLLTAIPLVILNSLTGSGDASGLPLDDLSAQLEMLCEGLETAACGQYVIVTQFMPMFLIMPVIIPITIASYSIVGEKTTRTLEPLLATPITTMELLLGKGLAAALPAVLATWASFAIFVIGALMMGLEDAVVARFFDPLWLLAILLVGPLLAVAAVSLAVMISSRTSEPRVAEQISGLLILPIVGLVVAQTTGFILLDTALVLWIALFLGVLDAGLLFFAVQLFQRESILTRWK